MLEKTLEMLKNKNKLNKTTNYISTTKRLKPEKIKIFQNINSINKTNSSSFCTSTIDLFVTQLEKLLKFAKNFVSLKSDSISSGLFIKSLVPECCHTVLFNTTIVTATRLDFITITWLMRVNANHIPLKGQTHVRFLQHHSP